MRLVLIGDIHTFTLKVHPRRLLSRRIMGQSNLWLNRRFRFNHRTLDLIIQRVREVRPDMILFSGDVTTTSLEDEFLDVERFLRPLADEFRTVLVPGNHDRYTFKAARSRRIERLLKGIIPDEFPHLEELTPNWRLLALDSATPGFMLSRGALGPTQMQGVEQAVAGLTGDHGLVVLCHYPVTLPAGVPSSWAHNLAEERRLRGLLAECPARVVFLHGHVHRPWHLPPDPEVEARQTRRNHRRRSPFTSINAGSPCMTSSKYPLGQGFWEIKLPEHSARTLTLLHHVPSPGDDSHWRLPRRTRAAQLPETVSWEAREVA